MLRTAYADAIPRTLARYRQVGTLAFRSWGLSPEMREHGIGSLECRDWQRKSRYSRGRLHKGVRCLDSFHANAGRVFGAFTPYGTANSKQTYTDLNIVQFFEFGTRLLKCITLLC